MALTHRRENGRAAFTLVELLVVIGIMGVLATISVAGYSAATRGMADRGVIQTTVSILRIAQQTCEIDRVPTKVLFFNRRLTEDSSQDDAQLYQGTAIAIKQAGRISIKPSQANGLLVDEFADWHQSYPMSGSDRAPGMRIYRMTANDVNGGIEDCSVLVKPFVHPYKMHDYMIQSGAEIDEWCQTHKREASDNRPAGASASYVPNGNNYVWGFEEATASGARGNASIDSWKVGDPYGVEIAQIDLPKGYIFGRTPPSDNTLRAASVSQIHFDPEEYEPKPNPGNLPVSAMRPVGASFSAKLVGTVNASMLDDKNP